MAKKDFSNVNTDRVYNTIQNATEELPGQVDLFQGEADPEGDKLDADVILAADPQRKARKTYSDTEKAAFLSAGTTSGHKGCKLPRMNMAFDPDLYDYVRTMATVRGETITTFVNHILRNFMNDNMEIYEKAIEFRNSL